jgi:hypothetical protein
MTNTIETFTAHLAPMGFTPDDDFGEDNLWELEHPERGMFDVQLLPPGHGSYDYSDGMGDEYYTNELDEPVLFMTGHGVTYVLTHEQATPEAITEAMRVLNEAADESWESASNYYTEAKKLLDKGDFVGALELGRRHYEDYDDDYGILSELSGLHEPPLPELWDLMQEAWKARAA